MSRTPLRRRRMPVVGGALLALATFVVAGCAPNDNTSKTSAGPVGVGTRYRQTRTIPGRSTEDFEVTVFQPARRLAIHGQIGPFLATISYQLEAAAGATTLVNNVELDTSQPRLRLLAPLATPRIKAAVAQNLGKLKLLLEDGRPA